MSIPEIKPININLNISEVRTLNIPEIRPVFNRDTPPAIPYAAPVTVELGVPIVDIPGCVEAHEVDEDNMALTEDDPKGTKTFCDADIPSFNPIDFQPGAMTITRPQPVPRTGKMEETEKPKSDAPAPAPVKPPSNTDIPKIPDTTLEIECPTPQQLANEPVGFIFDSGRKQIVGYELQGTECKRIVDIISVPAQILNAIPPAGVITTTASIAVVATSSALVAKPFADILLRIIKPVTKKIIKKIASIRGKKVKALSLRERRAEQRDRNKAIKALRSALKPKG